MTIPLLIVILLAVVIIGLLLLGKANSIALSMSQRLDVETQIASSIKKVESVLAGSGSKGSAGENIVELALTTLPSEWLVRNFVVGNKTVEFGVRLPNNVVLPIDSKFPATDLLAQFAECQDAEQRRKLKARIHSQTTSRALEVQKYLLPDVTTPFGLAVVPDPVFAICAEIAPMLSQQHVMLVSYNMLIPYILLIFHMTLKDTRIDLQRLDAFVSGANQNVIDIRDLIQTRFSRATVMLGNFRDETEAQLSKLSANIAALRTVELTSAESSGPETDAAAASQNGS